MKKLLPALIFGASLGLVSVAVFADPPVPQFYAEAQKIAMEGYYVGEQIRKKIENVRKDSAALKTGFLENDLRQMRVFYKKRTKKTFVSLVMC